MSGQLNFFSPQTEKFATNKEIAVNVRAKLEALNQLALRSNYTIKQSNGQRTFGGPPPNWQGPPPPQGCEIFVGNVPRDVLEDEVVPIFETAGTIYELRMMMDFSGTNRGFFFVRYTTREGALKAIENLDRYEIRPGKMIGVKMSVDNRKLFISGLDSSITVEIIRSELDRLSSGVIGVRIFHVGGANKACCIVEFESHMAAAQARRVLVPQLHTVAGCRIQIEWAKVQMRDTRERSSMVRNSPAGGTNFGGVSVLWPLIEGLNIYGPNAN